MSGAVGSCSSCSSAYGIQAANSLAQAKRTAGTDAAATSGAQGSGSAAQADLSPIGQLLAALQQLQTQSPAQYSQVTGQIASQIQTAAQQAGQTGQNSPLNQLANAFQQASSSGQLPKLHHHHGNHNATTYGAGGQLTDSGSTQSSDASSAAGSQFQQLLESITSEVNSALAQ